MVHKDILQKIDKANLTGRGGGCFPVAKKWEIVKNTKNHRRYVVCNCSEGEPGVLKDAHILENNAERVIDGIRVAIEFLDAEKAIFYINKRYYSRFGGKLNRIIKKDNLNIEVFVKPKKAGYIGGAETAALNTIEGGKTEPRLRPPYPTVSGLWDCPTLINNVETFYDVSMVMAGKYKNTRFVTIGGDCIWDGVYEFPETMTINEILKKTKNMPDFDFFVQIGGDASGIVLNHKQLDVPVSGSGSITIYSIKKHDPIKLMKKWVNFFQKESCGQCTPCREGTFRLKEILYSKNPDWKMFGAILVNLRESSICGLGCVVPVPFQSYTKNVLNNKHFSFDNKYVKAICSCFNENL